MKRMKRWIKGLLNIIHTPAMRILPGNLAFFLGLSIVPLITLTGYIASLAGISVDSLVNFLNESLPKEVYETLMPFVSGTGIDTNVILFMMIGFFLASNGPHSIIIASNMLFGVEEENDLKRRIKAIFMTILMMLIFFFMVIGLGFGNLIIKMLLSIKVFAKLAEIFWWFKILRWPLAFILVFYMLKVIYTVAIDKNISSKYMNKGAFFTTLCIIVATFVYSFYINNFANYNLFYGSLSNIMITMVWIYIISFAITLGIAINAKLYKERIKQNKE